LAKLNGLEISKIIILINKIIRVIILELFFKKLLDFEKNFFNNSMYRIFSKLI